MQKTDYYVLIREEFGIRGDSQGIWCQGVFTEYRRAVGEAFLQANELIANCNREEGEEGTIGTLFEMEDGIGEGFKVELKKKSSTQQVPLYNYADVYYYILNGLDESELHRSDGIGNLIFPEEAEE